MIVGTIVTFSNHRTTPHNNRFLSSQCPDLAASSREDGPIERNADDATKTIAKPINHFLIFLAPLDPFEQGSCHQRTSEIRQNLIELTVAIRMNFAKENRVTVQN
ncbi:hypothetical protein EP7_002595 [Isosphaeraceae bacterium EP7]